MCIKILAALGKILTHEYIFLLKGGVVLDKENQIDNPCSKFLGLFFFILIYSKCILYCE